MSRNCRSLLKLLSLLLAVCHAIPAGADRDIVYAARCYAPPGSRRTSHFHLYRVNPDGTGRIQLTFGSANESDPQWSPDGTKILFVRVYPPGEGATPPKSIAADHGALCLIGSQGGRVTTLLDFGRAGAEEWNHPRWSSDGRSVSIAHHHWTGKQTASSVSLLDIQTRQVRRFAGATDFLWSPDGKHALLRRAGGDAVLDLKTGRQTAVKAPLDDPLWLDARTLLGIAGPAGAADRANTSASPITLQSVGLGGTQRKQIELHRAVPAKSPYAAVIQEATVRAVDRIPGKTQAITLAFDGSNSTVRPNNVYCRADLRTGAMQPVVEGQFLAWSPDGGRYCTAPGRDLAPYAPRKIPLPGVSDRTAARYRQVWIAPLKVGDQATDAPRSITPGLVWVTGADWRKARK